MARSLMLWLLALLLPAGGVGAAPPSPSRPAPPPAPRQAPVGGKKITLAFTGDVSMTWRGLPATLKQLRWNQNPLRFFAPVLKAADLAISNCEAFFLRHDPRYADPKLNLWAPEAAASVFTPAGVDLVSTANNHAFDGRDKGVLRTLELLRASGVKTMGTGRTEEEARRPFVWKKHGSCIAFIPATTKTNKRVQGRAKLAYYPVKKRKVSWPKLAARVRRTAKTICPFVTVYIHWGEEKLNYPPKKMKLFSRMLVDAGAQLVVGHHPHVLQGVEFYRGGVIVYSLGNFVFSNPTIETRRTGVLWTELAAGNPSRVTRLELVPAVIHRKDYAPCQ